MKSLFGEGPEPDLAMGEGLTGRFAFEDLAVELEDKERTGKRFDRPESAKNVGDLVAEEATGKTNVFGGDGLVSCDGSFTTCEGDEVVVVKSGDFAEVEEGELVRVLQSESA
jgi:hypothetical protein